METNNQKNDQNIIPNDADKQQKGVNVPNLRFSEFNVCWTTYKLETCAKIYDGTHQTPKYTKSGIRFISVENISNLYDSQKFISLEDFKKEFKIHPQINDILMTRIGDIGTPAVVSKEDPLAYYVSLALIRPLKNLYYLYIYDYIQTPYFKKELWHRTLHIAFPQKINKEEIGKCKISIPCEKEQFKIGNFLSLLDQRIYTQSKIIEDLELFKKGIWNYIYLTKSSDWKCVKLSDILCERKDFALKGDEFIHATLSKDGIFAKTDRYDRDFLVTNDEKEYKITRLNDICYNPANLKFGVICLNKFGDAIFSPIYVTYIVKNDFIPSFVELILTSSRFLKYIRKYEQGTVYERMAVNSEDFLKGEILIPTKDKQKAIADYFDMLDLKIKKEKDILELYKKQKAYLLKNMFI